MTYIPRAMETIVKKLDKEYPAIMVTGPRQCGKTTMLKSLMAQQSHERAYVSLDDLSLRDLAVHDPATFFQIHKPPLMIDEVQYAPQLFPYIKMIIDREQKPSLFWLTGSQIFKLMDGVQESLAGRVALLSLPPLSQSEISGHIGGFPFSLQLDALVERQKKVPAKTILDIFQAIHRGGMPALVSGKYSDGEIFYSSYLGTYVDRDVKEVSGRIDSLRFSRFMTSCAARCSQLVNYHGLAEDAEVDQSTVKNWLHILERLGIIFYLHPYSNNVLKRTIKTPKLYFHDTGLVCYLTRWTSAQTALNGAMSGALFENYVVSEVKKSYQNAGREAPLYYYRDRDGKEIDLIIEQNGVLHPIEIKKTAKPEPGMLKNFSRIASQSTERGTGAVVCAAEQLGAFDAGNLIVPVSLI